MSLLNVFTGAFDPETTRLLGSAFDKLALSP
jgi:hypothetical protein